ncbi:MAG: class IV adenylate cyclase [Chloroflexi bacterium]|nr:class IV adenylate cyclase [Chloroflexota bacterium]
MINIEIKARYPDHAQARTHLERLQARRAGVEHQRDTYFVVPKGRLKLRERDAGPDQLVYYERPNQAGPKRSDYVLVPVEDSTAMGALLERALGAWVIVDKRRDVWLLDNVRIHLDDVKGLGAFLEFEAVCEDEEVSAEYEKVHALMNALGIGEQDLIEGSYSDLLLDR